MLDTLLRKWLPGMLIALAVALPGVTFGAPVSTPDFAAQQLLTADDGSGAASSHLDYAGSGIRGPFVYYSTACLVAEQLEDCGYCTAIRLADGWWYVIYW